MSAPGSESLAGMQAQAARQLADAADRVLERARPARLRPGWALVPEGLLGRLADARAVQGLLDPSGPDGPRGSTAPLGE
jgi:hypothetical protein